MARMHSRDKGKSKSTRPSTRDKPSWLRYTSKEVELLIIKLAKEEHKPSKIGLILRDSYGIPSVKDTLGKGVSKVLKDNDLFGELPEDLLNLIKKSVMLKKHVEENKQDMTAKRGTQLTESKINRLIKYYKKAKVLPNDWKYDESRFKLIAE
jgi:small subunit ribosomal protein S15